MPRQSAAKTKLATAQIALSQAANIPTSTSASTPTSPVINPTTNSAYGGVTLPTFEPNQYLANDLFTDSSQLPQTTKQAADSLVQSISEKRETLRVVSANLQLNTDVFKTASLSEKMSQAAIGYSTDRINTEAKLLGLESAKVNLQIADSKLSQTREKLNHETITLEGLRDETEQRRRFWQAKYELAETRIKTVELAKYTLETKIGSIETEAQAIE